MISRIDSDTHTLVDFVDSDSKDIFEKARAFAGFMDDWRSKKTYSYHRLLTSACSSHTTIWDPDLKAEKEMLVLASNNYFGLNKRKEVMAAAKDAVDKYGSGMCGSRFLSGTYDLVVELEKQLADFEHAESAMVFTTGYQANVGTIAALMRPKDVVFIDKLCHASIIDGCRQAGCTIRVFRHNDVKHLERLLRSSEGKYRGKLIVVDGVFSMDGDLAPLDKIVELAERYNSRIMVDEAHATAVVGPTGRGTVELFGVEDRVDIVLGTFSKAFAATGGFIAAKREVIEYVRHYGRSYMFSASPVPAVVAAVLKSLEIIRNEPELRKKLWDNVSRFYKGLKGLGYTLCPDPPQSGILTILIGPDDTARAMSREIYERGLFISTGCYPAVAQNSANLRLSMSAQHSFEDIDKAIDILGSVGRKYRVI